jgi:DNA-binding NarL/FixJ family response regulator
MVFWIIEDTIPDQEDARDAIMEATHGVVEPIIETNNNFEWPPASLHHRPDIIILDLLWYDMEPRGISFYKKVREKYPLAMVIVWSRIPADDLVKKELDPCIDRRLILLPKKEIDILEEAIRGVLGRLDEEETWK